MEGDYEFLFFYWDNVFNEVKDLILKFFVVNYNECFSVEEVLLYLWVKYRVDFFGCEFFSENFKVWRKFKVVVIVV